MLKKIKGYISEFGNQSSDPENQKENEKNIINNACAALLKPLYEMLLLEY